MRPGPRRLTRRTASGPSNPWTLARARAARRLASVSSPQKPSWRPRAATASSGIRARWVIAPVGRDAAEPVSQPSSCQRTRSAMEATCTARGSAAAPRRDDRAGGSCRHTRASISPCSVSTSIRRRVQARPSPSRRSTSSSASDLAAKAATSTLVTGGSSSAATPSSGGGRRLARGCSSRPVASRCARMPSGPKRAAMGARGRAARSPRVRRPRRISRSVSSGRSRTSTGKGARKPSVSPEGTIQWRPAANPSAAVSREAGSTVGPREARSAAKPREARPAGEAREARSRVEGPPRAVGSGWGAWRAARLAAKRPSAMPTWQRPRTPRTWSTVANTLAVSVASPPWYLAAPRAGKAHSPGRSTSIRGVSDSTATSTGSKARASRSGSCAISSSSGQHSCAWRRRWPGRTPSARAASEHASTRPASSTATGSVAGTPAAATGQSGHQIASTRAIDADHTSTHHTDWRRRLLDAALVVSTSLPFQGRTTRLSIPSSTART